MPFYSLLGISVFIPDLADITAAIVAPIESYIQSVIAVPILRLAGSISGTISGFFAQIGTQLSQLGSAVYNTTVPLVQQILFRFNSLGATLYTTIAQPIISFVQSIPSQLQSFTSALGALVRSAVQGVGSFIWNGIQTAWNDLRVAGANTLAQLEKWGNALFNQAAVNHSQRIAEAQSLSARAQAIHNATIETNQNVKQLFSKDPQTNPLAGILQPLTDLAKNIWSSFRNFIVKDIIPALQTLYADLQTGFAWIQSVYTQAVGNIFKSIRAALIGILPKTPEQAVDNALSAAIIGAGLFISGEITAVAIEAAYPTKNLGVRHIFSSTMELTGIAAVSSAVYGIIVESSYGILIRQYFNFQIQPKRLDPQRAEKGVWYGVETLDEYGTELRYEGYSNEAIAKFKQTLYRPMPTFILEKLLELQVVTDAFGRKQLLREGFDPADVADLQQAFQNLALNGFQNNAKSILYTIRKAGFIQTDVTRNIFTVFAIPRQQQDWILAIADLDYKFAQATEAKALLLNLVKKAQLDPASAIAEITSLGFSEERAKVEVEIAAVSALSAPNKDQRQAILQRLADLGVVSLAAS